MTGWINLAPLFLDRDPSGPRLRRKPSPGAVVSQTGSHAGAAADYRKGLLSGRRGQRDGGLLGRADRLQIKDDA